MQPTTRAPQNASTSGMFMAAWNNATVEEIRITGNFTLDAVSMTPLNRSLLIVSSGGTFTITRDPSLVFNEPMLDVGLMGVLTLSTVTFDGGGPATVNQPIVRLASGAKLNIEPNTILRNNFNRNNGGAVYAATSSQIIIEGAVIDGNKAKNGGGVYLEVGADLEIKQSSIFQNNVATSGAAIYVDKAGLGGIHINEPDVEFNNNTATWFVKTVSTADAATYAANITSPVLWSCTGFVSPCQGYNNRDIAYPRSGSGGGGGSINGGSKPMGGGNQRPTGLTYQPPAPPPAPKCGYMVAIIKPVCFQ